MIVQTVKYSSVQSKVNKIFFSTFLEEMPDFYCIGQSIRLFMNKSAVECYFKLNKDNILSCKAYFII